MDHSLTKFRFKSWIRTGLSGVCLMLASILTSESQIYLRSLPNSGVGGSAQMVIDSTGRLYFGTIRFATDSNFVLRLNPATGQRDTLMKLPFRIAGLEMSQKDSVLYLCHSTNLFKYVFATQTLRSLNSGFEYPTVLRLRKKTNELYCIEVGGDNGRAACLAKYDVVTGQRTKIAGGFPGVANQEVGYVNGVGDVVRFGFTPPNGPFKNGGGLAFSEDEDTLYIGDAQNRCIRKLNLISGEVSTFAGPLPDSVAAGFRDGFRYEARFNFINGMVLDKQGNLLVADNGPFTRDTTFGNRIRKISPAGQVRTILGSGVGRGTGDFDNLDFTPGLNGLSAKIGNLSELVFDKNKDSLYINQAQRITVARKRTSSLGFFPALVNREIGSGAYAIKTRSNSAQPTSVVLVSAPANVTFADDSVDVPGNAALGEVVVQASQTEDPDSMYTTTVRDTFLVVEPTAIFSSLAAERIRIFPNPVASGQSVRLSAYEPGSHFRLIDAQGKLCMEKELKPENRIPADFLLPGLYRLELRRKSNEIIGVFPLIVH